MDNDYQVVLTNFYDKEEIIENCTVQILTNTKTGEVSVGWWRGTKDDVPVWKMKSEMEE